MLILPHRIALSMRTLLACASLTLFLAACGYKGPLVLPQQPKKAAPPAAHAAKPDASAPKREASAPGIDASAAR
ncbi:hypothetical protein CV_0039 [Chromobacterium violaceum ATCC 12472]|uniref:Lipoprotein n=2 Tax=Chromobacterium violaceum TaxID=536 RepID=Q7P222_CHRVO|nr:hypothetical protein CV_0039 [Chromobacterium violaceum ATCC 12472]MBA8733509.1 lipoprotein [Chromobacterium violaceum]QIY79512.1 lipoprotein [Chromobacterium violaceum]